MIVDPDFFDHWKTLLLIDELEQDQAAPIYVMRLWAHCQNRRKWVFDSLSDKALKALCRYPGHANKLLASLVSSGFVRVSESGETTVVGWETYNASLIANWSNGAKGGRPKKKKTPAETQVKQDGLPHQKPMGYPSETQAEPIRVDRIGSDNTHSHTHDESLTEGFSQEWNRWCSFRLVEDGRPMPEVQAEAVLMDLNRRGAEKARRDLEFSLRKGSKSILDADDDFQKRRKPSGGSGKPKVNFEDVGA